MIILGKTALCSPSSRSFWQIFPSNHLFQQVRSVCRHKEVSEYWEDPSKNIQTFCRFRHTRRKKFMEKFEGLESSSGYPRTGLEAAWGPSKFLNNEAQCNCHHFIVAHFHQNIWNSHQPGTWFNRRSLTCMRSSLLATRSSGVTNELLEREVKCIPVTGSVCLLKRRLLAAGGDLIIHLRSTQCNCNCF